MGDAWLDQCRGLADDSFRYVFGRDPQGSTILFYPWEPWGILYATGGTLTPGGRVANHTLYNLTGVEQGWWRIDATWANCYRGSWKVTGYYLSGVTWVSLGDVATNSTVAGTQAWTFRIVAPSRCVRIFFALYTYGLDGDGGFYPNNLPVLTLDFLRLACPDCPTPL